MKKYTPVDPLSLPPALPGKGLFTRIFVPDDGDKRKAAIYAAALEALANALEWVRYRLVDGLGGGTYGGPLNLAQLQSFSNIDAANTNHPVVCNSNLVVSGHDITCHDLSAGENVFVGNNVFATNNITAESGVQGQTVTALGSLIGQHLELTGAPAVITGITHNETTEMRAGHTKYFGASAYRDMRRLTVDVSAPNIIDPATFDRALVPDVIPATLTVTISDPPPGVILPPIPFSRRTTAARPHTVHFTGSSGGIASFIPPGAGQVDCFTLHWDGAAWYVSDVKGAVAVP